MITALPNTFEQGIRSIHDEPKMSLGEAYHSAKENAFFTYVRFAEDVEVGDVVRTKYVLHSKNNLSPQQSGGSVYAPAGTRQITEHDADYFTSLAGANGIMNWDDRLEIAITGGSGGNAGAGQHGIITGFNEKTLNVLWYSDVPATRGMYTTGQLTTALDNTSLYEICAPWLVEKTGDTTDADNIGNANGVVIVPAKKHQYALIAYCTTGFVKVAAAVKAGQTLFVKETGATDEGEGAPQTTTPPFGAYATVHHTATANTLVKADIYCTPISIVDDLARQAVRGFRRPRPKAA